jgi:hypothetical protein
MAIETQGVRITRASSVTSTLSTTYDITSSAIEAAGVTFTSAYSTGMFIATTDNTALQCIKTVATTKIEIHGTFGTTGSTARKLTGYTMELIGEITDFTGPGGQAQVIDITSINSTAKEKLIGIRDEGQVSISLNYSPTDAGQVGLKEDRDLRTRQKYAMRMTDVTTGASALPSWCYFNGYCLAFSISGAVDNKVSANAVLEIDGAVIWSTKVT